MTIIAKLSRRGVLTTGAACVVAALAATSALAETALERIKA